MEQNIIRTRELISFRKTETTYHKKMNKEFPLVMFLSVLQQQKRSTQVLNFDLNHQLQIALTTFYFGNISVVLI